jgi:hypothetical protein
MKKSKIFIGAATLILGSVAFFATKANNKFFAFGGKILGSNATGTLSLNSAIFTAVQSGSLKTVFLQTTSGATFGTLATSGGGIVYRK